MDVGFIGWRGMVGSVLRQRMDVEGDWATICPTFFSTSSVGGSAPQNGGHEGILEDALDLEALAKMPVLVSCQGGDYTRRVHPALRAAGWTGHWIDAASALRMAPTSCLVLDPINSSDVDAALDDGVKDYVGANCTVSLMMMGIGGLLRTGWVRWVSTMTYQAASGAGAAQMRELVDQMRAIGHVAGPSLDDPSCSSLELEARVTALLQGGELPTARLGHPLAGSVLPWVDSAVAGGQSREEWKGAVETNRLLGHAEGAEAWVPVDGICVRVGALRCHAQGLTIGLDRARDIEEVQAAIAATSPWTQVVENTPEATLKMLTPTAVTGSLTVPVGRIRRMRTDPCHIAAFTVGDQLLWGAAEPVRRVLGRVVQRQVG